ncbi:MAG: type II secretion system protein N [Deltaproteobacteria bacterium]|nr:type II secretion system protein N [Deltaproteobacteria bacterium]
MDRLFQLTTKNLLGALNLVLVVLCAYVAANIVNNIRKPSPDFMAGARVGAPAPPPASAPRTFDAYRPILDRNLFKAALEDAPVAPVETELPDVVEESPLQAKLIATIVSGNDVKSTATIEILTTRERKVFRKDDTLMDEAKVVSIERERVIVLRKGAHEKLSLYDEDGKPSGVPLIATPPQQPPAFAGNVRAPGGFLRGVTPRQGTGSPAKNVMTTVSEFNASNSDFRVMPNFRQGRMDGVRIFAVTPESKWAKSGLRNGDVVKSVNGREVVGADALNGLLAELKDSDDLVLDVQRGGTAQTIKLDGGS